MISESTVGWGCLSRGRRKTPRLSMSRMCAGGSRNCRGLVVSGRPWSSGWTTRCLAVASSLGGQGSTEQKTTPPTTLGATQSSKSAVVRVVGYTENQGHSPLPGSIKYYGVWRMLTPRFLLMTYNPVMNFRLWEAPSSLVWVAFLLWEKRNRQDKEGRGYSSVNFAMFSTRCSSGSWRNGITFPTDFSYIMVERYEPILLLEDWVQVQALPLRA